MNRKSYEINEKNIQNIIYESSNRIWWWCIPKIKHNITAIENISKRQRLKTNYKISMRNFKTASSNDILVFN